MSGSYEGGKLYNALRAAYTPKPNNPYNRSSSNTQIAYDSASSYSYNNSQREGWGNNNRPVSNNGGSSLSPSNPT